MPCLFLVMEDVRPFIHSLHVNEWRRALQSRHTPPLTLIDMVKYGQLVVRVARLMKKSRRSQTHVYRLGLQDPGKQHTGTLSIGGWWARESEACRTQYLTHKPWHVPGMRMNKVGREAGLTLSHQVSYCVGTRRAYRES